MVLTAGVVCAQHAPSKLPPIKFSDTTLDNGLRVIISEDHYAPVFGIAVSYKVGRATKGRDAPGSPICSST